MNNRKDGFTLIELLIVIAIIGILAAIAIPNLLNAVQRAKQKRSVADIKALATALEAYHVDNGVFPTANCTGIFSTAGSGLTGGSFTLLKPTYIAVPPVLDGWGRFLIYNVDAALSQYNIRSYGRDGSAGAEVCFTTTNFNDDIIFANGTFVQWPDGSQN